MIRERLERYRYIRQEIEQIEQQLADIEAALYNAKIQRLSDMPSAPTHGNAQEDMAIKHIALQEYYRVKRAELVSEQLFVEEAIATLEPVHRLLMRYRYIAGMDWLDICDAMGYGRTYLYQAHLDALAILEASET